MHRTMKWINGCVDVLSGLLIYLTVVIFYCSLRVHRNNSMLVLPKHTGTAGDRKISMLSGPDQRSHEHQCRKKTICNALLCCTLHLSHD